MSTIVPMPVRVKPPPAETGEIISPGCASFEITTPLNGARTTMSVSWVFCRLTWLSATPICCVRMRDPRLQRVDVRLRLVELRLADDPFLQQLLPPAERELRLLQARLVLGRRLARRGQLRLRQRQRGPRLRVVEVRQDLPGLHRLPFLDQDVDHLAGDLRRDRRAPPRHHVARGVEHGPRGRRPAGLRRRRRHLDRRRPASGRPVPGARRQPPRSGARMPTMSPTGARAAARALPGECAARPNPWRYRSFQCLTAG